MGTRLLADVEKLSDDVRSIRSRQEADPLTDTDLLVMAGALSRANVEMRKARDESIQRARQQGISWSRLAKVTREKVSTIRSRHARAGRQG